MKRTYVIAILICLLFQRASAQSEHIIQGKILGAGGKKIFLVEDMFYKPTNEKDSVVAASDGSFMFKKMLSEPTIYVLGVKGGPVVNNQFIVDGPKTTIWANSDSIKQLNVTGSREDILFKRLLKGFNAQKTMNDFKKAIDSAIAKKDLSEAKRIEDKYSSWTVTALKDSVLHFIDNHKGTLAAAIGLAQIKNALSTLEFQRYLGRVKSGFPGMSIINYLQRDQQAEGPQVDDVAVDFSQPHLNGKMVKLSDYKGKYVLLDFWASWCAPCRIEHPNLIKSYRKFKPKGFTILSVSLDTSKENWKKAIVDDGLLWSNVSDLTGWDNYVVKLYSLQAVPANFLIDPNGKIIAKGLRGAELDKKLAEIFEP